MLNSMDFFHLVLLVFQKLERKTDVCFVAGFRVTALLPRFFAPIVLAVRFLK